FFHGSTPISGSKVLVQDPPEFKSPRPDTKERELSGWVHNSHFPPPSTSSVPLVETMPPSPDNIVGGSFFGNLLIALSISSNLRDGQDSADLAYSSDSLVSSLYRPTA